MPEVKGNAAFTSEATQDVRTTEQIFFDQVSQNYKDKTEKPRNQIIVINTNFTNQGLLYGCKQDNLQFLFPDPVYSFNPNVPIYFSQKKIKQIDLNFEYVNNYNISYDVAISARIIGLPASPVSSYDVKVFLCFASVKVPFISYSAVQGIDYIPIIQVLAGTISIDALGNITNDKIAVNSKKSNIYKIDSISNFSQNNKDNVNYLEKESLQNYPNIAYLAINFQDLSFTTAQRNHLNSIIFDCNFDFSISHITQYSTN
jgi:hypothetical protein